MDETIPPTLAELARRTTVFGSEPPPDDVITEALVRAEVDPTDEKERERFRHLVREAVNFEVSEERSRLRDYIPDAEVEAGENADEREVLAIAGQLAELEKDQNESYERQREDFYTRMREETERGQ